MKGKEKNRSMVKLFLFLLCFLCFNGVSLGADFNVKDYGAKADGRTDDAQVGFIF